VREGYASRSAGDQRKLVRRSLRHILAADDDDAAAAVRNLVQEIEVSEHPFAPDVRPARDWPPTAAMLPEHLRIVFSEPVLGPLIVGRDRRFGLGLMRPAD
jgi:CRISPR-associated protein Csb2